MSENSIIKWQNSYSVGIKLVDEQHKELIKLTNKLFLSCSLGQDQLTSVFMTTIHEAIDYVVYHFGTEEKIMERVNYPHIEIHRNEHKEFAREVLLQVEDFKSGKTTAPLSFVNFLKDWVLNHVAVSDKKMGDYLVTLKKSGELDRMTLVGKKD